jgi:hypothetical protein
MKTMMMLLMVIVLLPLSCSRYVLEEENFVSMQEKESELIREFGSIEMEMPGQEQIRIYEDVYFQFPGKDEDLPLFVNLYFPPDHDFSGSSGIVLIQTRYNPEDLDLDLTVERAKVFACGGLPVAVYNPADFTPDSTAQSITALFDYLRKREGIFGIDSSRVAFMSASSGMTVVGNMLSGLSEKDRACVRSVIGFYNGFSEKYYEALPTSAHYHFLSWKLDSAGLHDNITSTIDYLENNNGEAEFIPVPSGGHIFEFNNTDAEVIQILENLVIAVSEDLNA